MDIELTKSQLIEVNRKLRERITQLEKQVDILIEQLRPINIGVPNISPINALPKCGRCGVEIKGNHYC